MLPYFILGVALLAGLLLAGRWFASADPRLLTKVLKWTAIGAIVAVAVFFLVTGRLAWAMIALPALLPWFLRARTMARTARNFSRMTAAMGGAGSAAPGQASDLKTRFLRMSLDHATGVMSGEVIDGPHAGRNLDQMGLDELLDLLTACRNEDPPSAQVLEAYLDRIHEDWRQRAAAAETGAESGEEGAFGAGAMSREEARQILGLKPGASEAEVKEAHHRLIAGLHPDHGGSTYLAAKINQAKDVLLAP